YNIYADGAKSNSTGFEFREDVEGYSVAESLYGMVDEVVVGDKTPTEWYEAVVETMSKY
ncbi:MAG: carbohydrate ABC transporter substrate-binding protein, partial [Erysipelothrix sp.]|nr:carbohydrate ABC transporter substrate-binding protein [Erysipelothrix sp.]